MARKKGPNYQTSTNIYSELSKQPQSPKELEISTGHSRKTIKKALKIFKEEGLVISQKVPTHGQPNRREYSIVRGTGDIAIVPDLIWPKYLRPTTRKEKRKALKRMGGIHREFYQVFDDFYKSEDGKEFRKLFPKIEDVPAGIAYDTLLEYQNEALCIECLQKKGKKGEVVWHDNEVVCSICGTVLSHYDEEWLRKSE
jgi:biotin operon repressor